MSHRMSTTARSRGSPGMARVSSAKSPWGLAVRAGGIGNLGSPMSEVSSFPIASCTWGAVNCAVDDDFRGGDQAKGEFFLQDEERLPGLRPPPGRSPRR